MQIRTMTQAELYDYIQNHLAENQNKLSKQTNLKCAVSCLTNHLENKLQKVKPDIYDCTNLEQLIETWFNAQPDLTQLTYETAIENHRRMWRWIANETKERRKKVTKLDYAYEINSYVQNLASMCWACEYANIDGCYNCPLKWGEHLTDTCLHIYNNTPGQIKDGIFTAWRNENQNWEENAKYAEQIAELPTR